ncbi:hypothetical protein [Pseudoduganella sp. OTU4001]|uniref:hypothetical protein n=1 Tax=Pseudoduganella sp. OTU4001 TaxID=3043854 RepID=UPI00313D8EA4
MIAAPHASSADCRTILADGRLATITATRRPRANRAEVKCVVPGAPLLAEAMQSAVRLARLTEAVFDSREQVVLSIDIAPAPDDRNWELAAVLADRMVRGIWRPASTQVTAAGWSDNWQFGELQGDPDQASQLLAGAGADSELGEVWLGGGTISHLGELTGQPHPRGGLSSARAWFPLHSGGINDALSWVEVSVRPLQASGQHDEESSIAAPALDLAMQQSVRQTVAGARHYDGKGQGRWQTAVRFAQARLHGESWQFALVMADRLARGREFIPRGRVIASGASSAWHAGRVDTVDGLEPKLELILRQARPGDRVLLPHAWQAHIPAAYRSELKLAGASLACVEKLGWI